MSISASEQATTSPTTLPSITTISDLDAPARAQILDLLFEPCTQLHTLSLPLLAEKKFSSYNALISGVKSQFLELLDSRLESDRAWLDGILNAHPRLGEKRETLSESSKREQEAMKKAEQLSQGTGASSGGQAEEIAEKLKRLNEEYEKKFDGLKYVTFVNGRPRPVIIEEMENKIQRGDLLQEKKDAIEALCEIAVDRAKKMGGA